MRLKSVVQKEVAREGVGEVVRGARSWRARGSWQGLGIHSSEMGATGHLSSSDMV